MLFLCAHCRGVHIVDFWVLTPFSVVDRYEFWGEHVKVGSEEEGNGDKMFFRNGGLEMQGYAMPQPRRPQSESDTELHINT